MRSSNGTTIGARGAATVRVAALALACMTAFALCRCAGVHTEDDPATGTTTGTPEVTTTTTTTTTTDPTPGPTASTDDGATGTDRTEETTGKAAATGSASEEREAAASRARIDRATAGGVAAGLMEVLGGSSGVSEDEFVPLFSMRSAPADATRRREARGARPVVVNAASHDDNEEYLSWLDFVKTRQGSPSVLSADYTNRIVLRVTDADGRPVMNRRYVLRDSDGETIWTGVTYASGESVVYPGALFDGTATTVSVGGQTSTDWQASLEGMVNVALDESRESTDRVPVDIAFVLDATGSMGDEIQRLRDVLFSIHSRLQRASDSADLRFGLVTYRDRGDGDKLHVVPFTGDVDEYSQALAAVHAYGGGDYPEDMHSGLEAALGQLQWRTEGIRAVFVIADAPPHTDYGQQNDYLWAARTANKRGIRINMIGASGLNEAAECMFRQIAGDDLRPVHLPDLRRVGRKAPAAGTAEDPGRVSHHTGGNWSSRRLDDIVVDLVRRDLAYQTDVAPLASDSPTPDSQQEMLRTRLENLWGQVARQVADVSADSLKVALLPFENALGDSSVATYLHDLSLECLLTEGKFTLVERDRIAAILSEHAMSASGVTGADQAVELGNLLNTRLVLMGRVYRLGTDRVVQVRAVDAETARIVAAARVRV